MGKKYTVFTYGSLMNGFYGYDKFMSDAEFLGEAFAQGDLRFFCSDYPVMIHQKGKNLVRGELYRVDDETMEELRKYEGLGNPFTCYTERLIETETKSGKVSARAFVVISAIKFPMVLTTRQIPEADWRVFKSSGRRLPVSRPLVIVFGLFLLGAAFEIAREMGLI